MSPTNLSAHLRTAAACVAAAVLLPACSDLTEPHAAGDARYARGGTGMTDVIVVLKQPGSPGDRGPNQGRAAQVAEELNLEARFLYGAALTGFSTTLPVARLNALRNHPHVSYVAADAPVRLPDTFLAENNGKGSKGSTSSTQITPWGVTRTGAAAHSGTGAGISVYVLDSGVDVSHPDLRANIGEGFASTPCQGSHCVFPWDDDNGHGTHVAGTIGAIDNTFGVIGVAPAVSLHPVKVLSAQGGGTLSTVIAGIDWVAAHNADRPRVANMSFGGGREGAGTCTSDGYEGTDPLHHAICNAKNQGVVFVAAAGNHGSDASIGGPAAYYDAVVTVSATMCNHTLSGSVESCASGTDDWAWFSAWGTGSDPLWPSVGTLPVLIAAPGLSVRSTWIGGGESVRSGTSMAAPHVAGAAALLLENASLPSTGAAFAAVRRQLLDQAECTRHWRNSSGYPHDEPFLNLRGAALPCGTATPANLAAQATSPHTVLLTWSDRADDVTAFEIWRSLPREEVIVRTVPAMSSFLDEDLRSNTEYLYSVRAVSPAGVSAWTPVVNVTTPRAVDDAPFSVSIVSYECSTREAGKCVFESRANAPVSSYTWTVEPQGNYRMHADEFLHIWFPTPGTYRVTVTATDRHGDTAAATQSVECGLKGKNLRCG